MSLAFVAVGRRPVLLSYARTRLSASFVVTRSSHLRRPSIAFAQHTTQPTSAPNTTFACFTHPTSISHLMPGAHDPSTSRSYHTSSSAPQPPAVHPDRLSLVASSTSGPQTTNDPYNSSNRSKTNYITGANSIPATRSFGTSARSPSPQRYTPDHKGAVQKQSRRLQDRITTPSTYTDMLAAS